MSNPFVPANVRLPPLRGITDPAVAEYLTQLNFALNAAFAGFLATTLSVLGIQQVEYGTMTFASPSTTVTFQAPMPDANYALVLAPLFIATAIAKTPTGFTISGTFAGAVDWIAVR